MFNQMVEQLDQVFRALADPTRRAIVASVADHELTIGALAAPLPMSFEAVSKHVRTLESAGLVRRRRVGREHRISLEPAPLREARSWLDRYREFWSDAFDTLDRVLEEEQP